MKIPLPTHQFDKSEPIAEVGVSTFSDEERARVKAFLDAPTYECKVCGCINHSWNRACPSCIHAKNRRPVR